MPTPILPRDVFNQMTRRINSQHREIASQFFNDRNIPENSELFKKLSDVQIKFNALFFEHLGPPAMQTFIRENTGKDLEVMQKNADAIMAVCEKIVDAFKLQLRNTCETYKNTALSDAKVSPFGRASFEFRHGDFATQAKYRESINLVQKTSTEGMVCFAQDFARFFGKGNDASSRLPEVRPGTPLLPVEESLSGLNSKR